VRRLQIIGMLAATAVAASLLHVPATQAAPSYELSDPISYIMKTDHGDVYVEAIHPLKDGKIVKAPAILTYSPYSILGRNGDADRWVPRGYVRIYADVVGTGNSGGCWDYGGIREKESGYDIVEWIAKQKWSTGKVGMIGGSYEGTTANAVAVMDPPHLTTIVPEAAIARWYDYAYAGGIRYNLNNEWLSHQGPGAITDEGLDTPLAFDFGLAIPPPLDPQDPNWAERVASTVTPCDELTHTQYGYDDTPDYDEFWLERDYVVDADKVDVPVLVAHNWGDWNVKQVNGWDFYHAVKDSTVAKLYMGTRWEGHGTPSGDYDKVVDEWMDHYLMGVDNGMPKKLPAVTSQTSDSEGALDYLAGRPKTTNVELIAQEIPRTDPAAYGWALLPSKPLIGGFRAPAQARFPSAGINTEFHAAHHAINNHDWWFFQTPTLRKDTRIFGEIKVQIYSLVYRKWVTFTPSILDIDPSEHQFVGGQHVNTDPKGLVGVTRGWLDTRYRNGLDKQVELTPGKPFGVTVVAHPQDYVFKKGHRIGLNIQTEINEWSLPKPYYDCDPTQEPDPAKPRCTHIEILWTDAKTRLILPVVDAPKRTMDLFDMGHHH
jgi:X-Pro dipeptidyl-peptidase